MKSFRLTSPFVNSGKPDWKDICCQETFFIWNFRQMKTFQLPSVEREGNRFSSRIKKTTYLCFFFFFRVVYNSNERSVDFCPIADIDSNSTVLVSISTSSPSSVPVSSSFLTSSHHNLMILTVYISELAEHMYFWLLCSKHSFAQQISLCGNHSKSRGR